MHTLFGSFPPLAPTSTLSPSPHSNIILLKLKKIQHAKPRIKTICWEINSNVI
jgi:hypothetical protein